MLPDVAWSSARWNSGCCTIWPLMREWFFREINYWTASGEMIEVSRNVASTSTSGGSEKKLKWRRRIRSTFRRYMVWDTVSPAQATNSSGVLEHDGLDRVHQILALVDGIFHFV